jgi:hypothetical protein
MRGRGSVSRASIRAGMVIAQRSRWIKECAAPAHFVSGATQSPHTVAWTGGPIGLQNQSPRRKRPRRKHLENLAPARKTRASGPSRNVTRSAPCTEQTVQGCTANDLHVCTGVVQRCNICMVCLALPGLPCRGMQGKPFFHWTCYARQNEGITGSAPFLCGNSKTADSDTPATQRSPQWRLHP